MLVAAVGVLVLASCGASRDSSTRATEDVLVKVDYPGRLLLSVPLPSVDGTQADHLSQLTSDSPDPTDLVGMPTNGYITAVSADGSRIAYNAGGSDAPQVTVYAPGGTETFQGGYRGDLMVFSPDGKRLAYNSGTSVQLPDPVTRRFVALLPATECKTYSHGPADSSTAGVCGGVGGPVWLDPTTLYLTRFTGEMPGSVSCPDEGRCTVPPDTATVVSVDGTVLTSSGSGPIYPPVSARGKTIVLDGSGEIRSFCSWLDVDQVRAGTGTVKALPPGALMHSLSPDGTKIVVVGKPGTPWQLVDIRSGAVQELGTRTTALYWPVSDVPVAWSPDGKFFAVQVGGVLVPHSKQYGSFLPTPGPGGFGTAIWVVPASSEKGGLVATLPASGATKLSSQSEPTILVGWAR